jgi:hypothetical protein
MIKEVERPYDALFPHSYTRRLGNLCRKSRPSFRNAYAMHPALLEALSVLEKKLHCEWWTPRHCLHLTSERNKDGQQIDKLLYQPESKSVDASRDGHTYHQIQRNRVYGQQESHPSRSEWTRRPSVDQSCFICLRVMEIMHNFFA